MSKGKLWVLGNGLKQIIHRVVFVGACLLCSGFFAEGSLAKPAATSAAKPAATPADWLSRMVTASASTTYKGLFIYESASGQMAMRIFHTFEEGKLRERLIYQNGPYREIVRYGDQLAFIRPDGDVSRYRTEGVNGLVDRLANYQDDLRHSYRLLFGSDDRVAGREALRIDIQPRDSHRYGYAIWIDRETALLLRSDLIDEKGVILERLQYVGISMPDKISAELLMPSREVVWQQAFQKSSDQSVQSGLAHLSWDTGWVPSGFKLAGISQTDSPVSQQKADSLLFSDGLATFSVFVEKDQSRMHGSASEQNGATSAVSHLFRDGEDYYNVTVIGEIPLGVAERVAVSVKSQASE